MHNIRRRTAPISIYHIWNESEPGTNNRKLNIEHQGQHRDALYHLVSYRRLDLRTGREADVSSITSSSKSNVTPGRYLRIFPFAICPASSRFLQSYVATAGSRKGGEGRPAVELRTDSPPITVLG